MKRFLVKERLEQGAIVKLDAEESRHAAKSLRLEAGQEVLITDGRGREAQGEVISAGPAAVEVRLGEIRESGKTVRLELLQSVLKGPKMDWLVEKATELGVSAIYPAQSERTVASGDRKDRWLRIAESAVKQSGNLNLPEIHDLRPLASAMALPEGAVGLMLQPGAGKGLADWIREKKGSTRFVLAIGPEGGFTETEEEALLAAGYLPAALSRQILRGETAGVAALAIAAHAIDF